MDWALAIEKNRVALTRIMGEVFALLGLVAGGTIEHLPQKLYLAAERLLRPAESALRRLIVIAARGLVLKPTPIRPMPEGLVIESKGAGKMAFRLFDVRKTFEFNQPENPLLVKVQTYTNNPFNLFNCPYEAQVAEQGGEVSAVQLSKRIVAFGHALETIPSQARRLARWVARRKKLETPKFTSPLRPGSPPGHQAKPRKAVDYILQECHWLAWDALRTDSS